MTYRILTESTLPALEVALNVAAGDGWRLHSITERPQVCVAVLERGTPKAAPKATKKGKETK